MITEWGGIKNQINVDIGALDSWGGGHDELQKVPSIQPSPDPPSNRGL